MQKQVRVMGILNVTPDSFSDGGCFVCEQSVRARIAQLLAEGAECIDVGGESSRPFAQEVSEAEELARVLPVIRAIRAVSGLPISIDTTKAEVARQALAAGATMINDISALGKDPAMLDVLRSCEAPLILMHMQGSPATMQQNPRYDNVVAEINNFFAARIAWLATHGIGRDRIILDPGIGFGKTLQHNLAILRQLRSFKQHDCAVLIGHSRKSFLGELLHLPVEERDCASAQVSAWCASQGVDMLRVHNVRATKEALVLQAALSE